MSLISTLAPISRTSWSRIGHSGCLGRGRGRNQRNIYNLTRGKQVWGNRLILSEEVQHALETLKPIVALESAIITHGMPYPANLSTATSLESIIRSKGAIPATVALINGKIHVGLTESELLQLSDTDSKISKSAVKVSKRDLGPAISLKRSGGTTVAGTMYIAESLGIKVFVTGGIGGVHRGAENSMDISADLLELGRTPMAVFCAGAKSILDIPRTLEVLETQGVCVASYGEQQDFPAFYTPSSGCQSPWRVGDADAAARLIYTQLTLPTKLATLIGVPIPSEHAQSGAEVQKSVEQAVRESVQQGIDKRGKEVTPWLLKRVGELTGGKALGLNVNLIENNARIGAEVAVKLSELYRLEGESGEKGNALNYLSNLTPTKSNILLPPEVLVFGSAAIDLTSTSPLPLVPRTTTPGTVFVSPGGVGRNIAEAAQNLLPPFSVQLEPDAFGKLLMLELAAAGLRTDGLIGKDGRSTAVCSLTLEENGDLVAGVADMGIVETIKSSKVEEIIQSRLPRLVVLDCNITEEVIRTILTVCQALNIPTMCDPTSLPKVPRLSSTLKSLLPSSPKDPRPLTHLSPNILELDDLYQKIVIDNSSEDFEMIQWEFINSLNLDSTWRNMIDNFTQKNERNWIKEQGIIPKMIKLLPFIQSFWLKISSQGLIHFEISNNINSFKENSISYKLEGIHKGKSLILTHYNSPQIEQNEIVSTTGAGDTLVGGLVAGLIKNEEQEHEWVMIALEKVKKSLQSRRAVG
uniref:Indigoidine synthase A family protein n=1 Tax=Kwoniella pini CBS 10737 TaxID=1296096 RepID=A0A1B9I6C1_9TREE|nr:indigoidine synthase A family protein [Kwoniella pini CBS 10737]OCF51070.1 indigoidine synthase A family protein [Kwoniella pini CBS 10737]